MKVPLTGATGFIGSHILAELEGHGHEVTALVRDDAQAETGSRLFVAGFARIRACRDGRLMTCPTKKVEPFS